MSDSRLKQSLSQLLHTIQNEPENAKVTFQAKTKLVENVRCSAKVKRFSFNFDEPELLGGDNTAPNPVEYVLASLGACQEILYNAFATFNGIPLESVSVDVKGDIDLRGLFGIDNIKPGFQEVEYITNIKSSADPEVIEQLIQTVEKNCPVLDILSRPIKVKSKINIIDNIQLVKQ